LVNNLYQLDKYRDLLDDIFFDAIHHNLSFIKKTETSPTEIRNSEFSPALINDIFEGFLKNSRYEGDFYYNRAENSVELVSVNKVVKFVHFYIDFNKNRNYVVSLFNKISPVNISNFISQNFIAKTSEGYDIGFGYIDWEALEEELYYNFKQSEVEDVVNKFKSEITLEWLRDLNEIS
jgi:hypothetical protein